MKCEAARDAARALNLFQNLRFVSLARNARLKNTTEQKAADLPHEHHINKRQSRKCVLIVVRLNVGYWMRVRLVLSAMCVLERGARSDTPSHANLSFELNSSVVCHFVFRSINEFEPFKG